MTEKIKLSAREVQIIRLLLDAFTIEDMAKEMRIAKRTVKAHLNRLFIKFRISNRFVKQVRLIHLLHHPEKIHQPEVIERSKDVRLNKMVPHATLQ